MRTLRAEDEALRELRVDIVQFIGLRNRLLKRRNKDDKVSIPRQNRGHYFVSRSKRHDGTATRFLVPPKGAGPTLASADRLVDPHLPAAISEPVT